MYGKIVVAIDGPAGAGKSTIARRLAQKLDCVYIDTGAMYRCVALAALRAGLDLADEAALAALARSVRIDFKPGGDGVLLAGEDVSQAIRTSEVASAASRVSAVSGVRRAMVEAQRRLGAFQSVVMEGRDIGSVVFPDAEVKVFLDADPSVRAGRRVLEMEQKGAKVKADAVAAEMRERDARDSARADSPLAIAPGAVRIDTTPLTIDEVEQAILKIIRERTNTAMRPDQAGTTPRTEDPAT